MRGQTRRPSVLAQRAHLLVCLVPLVCLALSCCLTHRINETNNTNQIDQTSLPFVPLFSHPRTLRSHPPCNFT